LGIPDTHYNSIITLGATEFTRICKELFSLSETVEIETTSEYVKFSVSSEVIGGSIKLENNDTDETGEKALIKVNIFICILFKKNLKF
jgi:proliferating cell nuclear antigen